MRAADWILLLALIAFVAAASWAAWEWSKVPARHDGIDETCVGRDGKLRATPSFSYPVQDMDDDDVRWVG